LEAAHRAALSFTCLAERAVVDGLSRHGGEVCGRVRDSTTIFEGTVAFATRGVVWTLRVSYLAERNRTPNRAGAKADAEAASRAHRRKAGFMMVCSESSIAVMGVSWRVRKASARRRVTNGPWTDNRFDSRLMCK
jgi:hypothetical protein